MLYKLILIYLEGAKVQILATVQNIAYIIS